MKKIYFLSIVLVSGLFLGCTSIKEVKLPNIHSVKHKVKPTPTAYSCNPTHFRDKYKKIQREMATKYFLYALFSSNNYDDNTYFSIPNWKRVKRYTSSKGFSADVYEKTIDSKVEEVVISFRGTNGLLKDWIFANLLIKKKGQYQNARDLSDIIFEDKRYLTAKKVTTGHSLGGALALHISTRYDNVEAYVFDTSPRIFAPKESEMKKNTRVLIREKGEGLGAISKVLKFGLKRIPYKKNYEYNFFKNGIIGDHSMYALARALLLMASVNNEKTAIKIQNEVAHCGFKFDEKKMK